MFYNLIQKIKLFLHTWSESCIIELYRRKATEHCNQTNQSNFSFASSVPGQFSTSSKHHQSLEELGVSRLREIRKPTITVEASEHRTGRLPVAKFRPYKIPV